ncbi:MAG: DUF169 domain-containing protein [Deltaproteobacteria bacterium]|nr:DUF169 domain-containing protein [Deltaproteobacteria bacterium]
MDIGFKKHFSSLWNRYFSGADLPIVFFYTNREDLGEPVKPAKNHRCVIGDLARVIRGRSLRFTVDTIGCAGGKRYLGFKKDILPYFEYFLSCGIPGRLEGERYKKTPELVKEIMKTQPWTKAPAKNIVFQRWDHIGPEEDPAVVIFFATPNVLSGLFTLANFDSVDPQGVIAPFGAGCASIVMSPFLELKSENPRPVIGMFDVSARPYVKPQVLTFAVPWPKFVGMVDNMEESFLITKSWAKVRKRIKADAKQNRAEKG